MFLEMFIGWSSTKHIFLSKPLKLIVCHGNQKAQFVKHFQKSTPVGWSWIFAEMLIALGSTKKLLHIHFGFYGNFFL